MPFCSCKRKLKLERVYQGLWVLMLSWDLIHDVVLKTEKLLKGSCNRMGTEKKQGLHVVATWQT